MATLNLRPLASGYTVTPKTADISVSTYGGLPRRRRDLLNATITVTCSFQLGREKYDYLMDFYRTYKKAPDWFLITMIYNFSDPNSMDAVYNAQIVPNTLILSNIVGFTYFVSMTLEASLAE